MTTEGMNPKRSKLVRFSGVSKVFKDPQSKQDVKAVNDVSFIAEPGQLVTLLGPSGCGKTTALRMIAGFEIPTAGKIFIGDEDITNIPPNLRDTAMVFQSYGLFPHMDVFENVAYGLRLRKIPNDKINAKVKLFLGMVGLEGLEKRPPSRLSGGQQQRVALARSLIVEPSVLLLDEPLSNLDALLREQMRVEIRRIQKNLGITAIYVTHDRTEAMSLSDKIIVMRKGRIEQMGTPSEIYRDPSNVFVAGFVGKAAFFHGKVLSVDTSECTVTIKNRNFQLHRFSPSLSEGSNVRVMCRPESLTLHEPGEGITEGRVKMNVYLGNSIESYIDTNEGEVLVQIDNPDIKHIYAEGEAVSVSLRPELAKALAAEA